MTSAENVLRLLRVEIRLAPEPLVRALMLAYLVDWKSSLDNSQSVTSSDWQRASWGPYSHDVVNSINGIIRTDRRYLSASFAYETDQRDIDIIENVRSKYFDMKTEALNKLVMSTYPMVYSSKEENLSLPALAMIYRRDFQKARDRAIA